MYTSSNFDTAVDGQKSIIRPHLNLAETINDLHKIMHLEELHEFMTDLKRQLHLKHFWHMIAPNKFLAQGQQLAAINDHPKEFEDAYIRGDKKAIDCPVLTHAYRYSQEPVLWSEMVDFQKLDEKQHRAFEWYSTYGFNNGICFPIHEPGHIYAVLTFILHDDKKLTDNEIVIAKNLISPIANLIHHKYKTLHMNSSGQPESKLTRRESECILWSIRGKTNWEIGKILNISEHTVSEYLCNCMKRFFCSNKVELVSKVILTNQISYCDI